MKIGSTRDAAMHGAEIILAPNASPLKSINMSNAFLY